jgi:adenosylmethionine-8-amino-7-oxononanoate aminotransferase
VRGEPGGRHLISRSNGYHGGLVDRARGLEDGFYAWIAALESHPLVGGGARRRGVDGRGRARKGASRPRPGRRGSFLRLAREAGLLTRGLRDGVAVAPPLIFDDEHVELLVDACETALDRLA